MREELSQITRGALEIIGERQLRQKLASGKKLRVKQGIDPTARELQLGYLVSHTVMRRFQQAGHTICLLWGDFTARIGDPTDKLDARAGMAPAAIEANIRHMEPALTRVFSRKNLEIRRNSEWWGGMNLEEFLKIAKLVSATQLWERDMFRERARQGKPVWSHEFLYPILQGYDSVMLKADVTVIGSDQKFNELVARDLQRHFRQEPQALVIMPLLVGLDGRQKMSQSLGNYVAIDDEPGRMLGRLMSMPDSNIIPYFRLLTDIDSRRLKLYQTQLARQAINPRDLKMELAKRIVSRLHSAAAAQKAARHFTRTFRQKKPPGRIKTVRFGKKTAPLAEVLTAARLADSKSEARRLIRQGGIKINNKAARSADEGISIPEKGLLLQRGKRRFVKVKP